MSEDQKTTPGTPSPINLSRDDKVQIVGFTVVLGAALTIAGLLPFLLKGGRPAASDDAPIVMAGGSFHIHAVTVALRHSPGKLVHNQRMIVYGIDFIGPLGKMARMKGPIPDVSQEIGFVYCLDLNDCNGSKKEVITLTFHNNSIDPVEISAVPPRDFPQPVNGVIHHPSNWTLKNVVFPPLSGAPTNSDSDCGSSGHCTVIIHTCEPAHTCS
jgi:hypothetical protein